MDEDYQGTKKKVTMSFIAALQQLCLDRSDRFVFKHLKIAPLVYHRQVDKEQRASNQVYAE